MSPRPFKPSIAFLEKVRDRKVFRWRGYRKRRGGIAGFTGGEVTYDKHLAAGYVTIRGVADLGRPAYAELTDKGYAFLARLGIRFGDESAK